MQRATLQRFLLAATLLLSSGYVYLNSYKLGVALYQMRLIGEGRPPLAVELQSNGETLAAARLPGSDIFDASGRFPVSFMSVDDEAYGRLRKQFQRLTVRTDGAPVEAQRFDGGNALVLAFPGRKLYVTHAGDLRTIAGILWQERRNRRDIFDCRGESLCGGIRIAGVENIGPLTGPYPDFDYNDYLRGMPRGRWGYGPRSVLRIEAARPLRATLAVEALGLAPRQALAINGGGEFTQDGQQVIGDKIFYKNRIRREVTLATGINTVTIDYSSWLNTATGDRNGMAMYLTGATLETREGGS